MQTEVIRIIEGGLSGDRVRVLNYAKTLAANLEKEGDARFARRINSVLANKRFSTATLDGLSSKPVDQESRMDIVDVEMVLLGTIDLVLSSFLEKETESFISMYDHRESITVASRCKTVSYSMVLLAAEKRASHDISPQKPVSRL